MWMSPNIHRMWAADEEWWKDIGKIVVTSPAGRAHTMILSASELRFSLSSRIIRGQNPAARNLSNFLLIKFSITWKLCGQCEEIQDYSGQRGKFSTIGEIFLDIPSTGYGELLLIILFLLFESGEQEKRCWNWEEDRCEADIWSWSDKKNSWRNLSNLFCSGPLKHLIQRMR